jgi:hypothetical protein
MATKRIEKSDFMAASYGNFTQRTRRFLAANATKRRRSGFHVKAQRENKGCKGFLKICGDLLKVDEPK